MYANLNYDKLHCFLNLIFNTDNSFLNINISRTTLSHTFYLNNIYTYKCIVFYFYMRSLNKHQCCEHVKNKPNLK